MDEALHEGKLGVDGEAPRVSSSPRVRKVALIGNHLPRRCGIATFTTDLCEALTKSHADLDCFVVAMNDTGERNTYPPCVRVEVEDGELDSYRRAADYLNAHTVDVACLQHEYGIFGGEAGAHVLALLRRLHMPVVTTLHTILAEPDAQQRRVMHEVTGLSTRVVVMSNRAESLLRSVYRVPAEKIERIPHGIAAVPEPARSKTRLGLADRWVLLTFGLLSPDKGVEHVIDALPRIREAFPSVLYVVLGATHPRVKRRHGEMYRGALEQQALRLGVDEHVVFRNHFVAGSELAESLAAADVHITPYLKREQVSSGSLAFAVGSGKVVVSTPYWYAEELLADGRGVLVPWRDPGAIAEEVIGLLGDEGRRVAIQERAAAYGREMAWPVVAGRYRAAFERGRRERSTGGLAS
jgi:glycosyltransferase involved in cell wall biosynthesis